MRLIFALFQMPFWVFMIASAGLFGLAELSHRDTLAQNQELERALASPPPETVSLSEFSRDENMGFAREISVQGVINPDYNYELTKRRKGPDTTRYMYVLFDAADPQDTGVARGALVLTEAEKDKFINEYYPENAEIAFGGAGIVSVITLNGKAERSPDLASLVNDAFDEQNLSKSDDFIYIVPFLEGRIAGLTPTMSANQMRDIIRGIGLFAAMIGLIKFGRRRRLGAAAPQDDLDAPAMGASFVPQMPKPSEIPETPRLMALEVDDVGADTPTELEKPKRKLPLKALALIALAAVAIYTGNFVYLAIGAIIMLQIVAVRKTRGIITGALGRFGIGGSQEERQGAVPEPRIQTRSEPEMAVAHMLAEAEDVKPKSGRFSISLPAFGRKPKDYSEEEVPLGSDPLAAPRRGSLPPQDALTETFKPDARVGLGDKLQLMLARLIPAGREPKAFAGRPDPFERLAAQARQTRAR